MEASVVPAFEKSCRAMFEQVDATFQKGMLEHTTAAQQHFESAHSPLAHALRVCMRILSPAFSFNSLTIDKSSSLMLSQIIMFGVVKSI